MKLEKEQIIGLSEFYHYQERLAYFLGGEPEDYQINNNIVSYKGKEVGRMESSLKIENENFVSTISYMPNKKIEKITVETNLEI